MHRSKKHEKLTTLLELATKKKLSKYLLRVRFLIPFLGIDRSIEILFQDGMINLTSTPSSLATI